MGIIKIAASLPLHIKAILVTVISLVGFWMIITPIYVEILAFGDTIPVWGWIIIGIGLVVFAARFGKAIMTTARIFLFIISVLY
ncbi:unnamed protein product [marine sediment metagenome]|uniref:Uncharacterized protein n=1 Tax=marine sediment metagenome TaxID=412755 RepID=X1JGP1_9ZZZZ